MTLHPTTASRNQRRYAVPSSGRTNNPARLDALQQANIEAEQDTLQASQTSNYDLAMGPPWPFRQRDFYGKNTGKTMTSFNIIQAAQAQAKLDKIAPPVSALQISATPTKPGSELDAKIAQLAKDNPLFSKSKS